MASLDHTDAVGGVITGSGSADTIDTTGSADAFTIDAAEGNDTVTTGNGNHTVNGNDGDDNITGGTGDDTLNGHAGIDTINGGDGGDNINGGADNDILNGDGGSDFINGGAGDDQINGGAGEDYIIASDGTDTVDGGTDTDTFQYNANVDVLTSIVDNGGGSYSVTTAGGTSTLTNIQRLWFNDSNFVALNDLSDVNNRFGTAAGDTINGDATNGSFILAGAGADTIDAGNGNNSVFGGAGDDVITVGTGDDLVDGGSDSDTVNFGFSTGAVTSYSNSGGTITIVSSEGTDTIRNVENFDFNGSAVTLANLDSTFSGVSGPDINGDANDNTLTGTASGETINGLAGNDTITPDAGDDTVDGGADTDTVIFSVASTDVTSFTDNGSNSYTIVSSEGTDTISNVESFQFSDKTLTAGNLGTEFASVNSAAQSLTGTSGDDTLTGGLADDTITPGAGNDTVDGGAGSGDTVVFSVASTDVTSFTDNGSNSYTIVSSEGTDTISNVESFQFSDKTVTAGNLTTEFASVNTAGQSVSGTSGDDTLTGGLGDDTITPGVGNDTVDGLAGSGDTVVFSVASTDVTSFTDNGSNSYTIVSSEGTDTIDNVENFQFSDKTVTSGNLATEFASVTSTNQTFTSTIGDDTFTGGNGTDKTVFGFAAADLTALSQSGGTLTVVGTEGTDTLTNIENLEFSDQTVAVSDLVFGTSSAETVSGDANNNIISAGSGTDTINAGAGNDLIIDAEIGETIDGGAGTDTVKFDFASSTITSAVRKLDGNVEVTTSGGTATLTDVENVIFASESSVTVDSLISTQNAGVPSFTVPDGSGGTIEATPEVYSGPVAFLEYQLLGDTGGNVVTGSTSNDFLNLLGGDDAANGGDGQDVLDGGTGSNFLTGGNGNDVFYLDGRGGTTTWSTIADFTSGDNVNIWGWVDGTSQLILSVENSGASGFEGATYHYDLNGDNTIDTSITFTGLTTSQVPDPTVADVAGGVLIFS